MNKKKKVHNMTSMHQTLKQTIFMQKMVQKMGIFLVISSFQILLLFFFRKKGLQILLNNTGEKSISIQNGSINSWRRNSNAYFHRSLLWKQEIGALCTKFSKQVVERREKEKKDRLSWEISSIFFSMQNVDRRDELYMR